MSGEELYGLAKDAWKKATGMENKPWQNTDQPVKDYYELLAAKLSSSLIPATLEDTLMALPDDERRKLYRLLYNSGCRI